MRREDGYLRREDEPTRPVRVPRLRPITVNDSTAIRVDDTPHRPGREPTLKLTPTSRW